MPHRFRGETKLEPSDRVLLEKDGNDYTLVIKGVALKEAGTYTVKAFADLGTESADANLTVKGNCVFNTSEYLSDNVWSRVDI